MPRESDNTPRLDAFIQQALPSILSAVNPARAIEMAAAIVENDRWNSFDRWHETSRRLKAAYDACGARGEITSIPTGGIRGTGKWIVPEAADIVEGTLDLIEPVAKRLADYRQCPWHVVQWSAATPREGIRCELVAIDTPEQFDAATRASLSGKFILTRLDPWLHRAKFCAAGAAGLLCDRVVADCPEAVAWTKFGWGGLDLSDSAAPLVGFAISAAAGDALRAMIEQGARPIMHATLDIRRYAGSHDVVSGVIQGREDPDAEIWAVAHSSEPGALDNASGGAACVEIARALNGLIQSGRLPRPRRTIRLLHGYECYGFFHYLEHTFRLQPPLAGVCLDTIGACPDVCHGELSWHATAPGSASVVDHLGFELLRATLAVRPAYQLRRKPFLSTEDTLLGDPKYGFPCPWITNHPCRGYHSSADTIEMLDAEGLAACTAAIAAYLYYLADASTAEALELARSQTRQAAEEVDKCDDPGTHARRETLRAQHEATIDRLKRFTLTGDHATLTRELDRLVETVAIVRAAEASPSSPSPVSAEQPGDLIPLRRLPLAPTPENVWPDIKRKLGASFPKWIVYWADGERSLAEIAELAALDADGELTLDRVVEHFAALAELRFVDLHSRTAFLTAEQLAADFSALGIRAGMDLMVHSSMKSIGPVRGGPATVVAALVSVLGPDGTLLAPSFNHFHARVFNPLTTPTSNGAIAEAMWRRADACRSLHPSHPVAAIGPRAGEYLHAHLIHEIWSADSPIGRLIGNDGHILSIGVGHDRSTAYHVAEIAMNVPCLDSFGSTDKIAKPTGEIETVRGLAWRDGECPVDPAGLDAMLEDKQSHGKVGRARATLVHAAEVFAARQRQLGDRCGGCSIRPTRRNLGEIPQV
jgi:aminoglycoside 3-N-acetyltransferase